MATSKYCENGDSSRSRWHLLVLTEVQTIFIFSYSNPAFVMIISKESPISCTFLSPSLMLEDAIADAVGSQCS
jgi:hypothetical protein